MFFLQLFFKRDTCVLTDLITKNNEKRHKTVIDGQGHNLLRIACPKKVHSNFHINFQIAQLH